VAAREDQEAPSQVRETNEVPAPKSLNPGTRVLEMGGTWRGDRLPKIREAVRIGGAVAALLVILFHLAMAALAAKGAITLEQTGAATLALSPLTGLAALIAAFYFKGSDTTK
jgi:hypothetical protein